MEEFENKQRTMSKAEERAKERYTIVRGDDTQETSGIDMQRALDFIEGYQQAEKDLALTWEDMRELYIIFAEVDTEIELCKTDIKSETIGYYQEVLKRFKNLKK